jgi:hypothetical protein
LALGKTVRAEAALACNPGAFSREQGERHRILVRDVFDSVRAIEELRDGYAFEFPAETSLYLRIAEWVTLERLCCPFLAFGLDLEHGAGSIRLKLTGPRGAKRFLRALLDQDGGGAPQAMVTPSQQGPGRSPGTP